MMKMKHPVRLRLLALICSSILFMPFAIAAEKNEFLEMSLKEILSVKVSSAMKKKELLKDTPAAVFVITSKDIIRSGVTTIPDALRMVPGLNVAQINMNQWAITSRGFNAGSANKLLVMIDGRTVYNSLFSGVYWSQIDTLLSDIDRIEVIRGPAGSLWGVNAVNGVINIITKHTIDTQGGLLRASVGYGDKLIESLRYGGRIKEIGFARGFLKYTKRGNSINAVDGSSGNDNWDTFRGGGRIDLDISNIDSLLMEGGAYHSNISQRVSSIFQPTAPFSLNRLDEFNDDGWNILSRWKHKFKGGNSTSLQFYYSSFSRQEVYVGHKSKTFDFDFQNDLSIGSLNKLVWGGGYRSDRLSIRDSFSMQLNNNPSTNFTFNIFAQDEIQIFPDKLSLIIGSKIERKSDNKLQFQPNARLKYTVDDSSIAWVSVSKASRTPTQFEHFGRFIRGLASPAPLFSTIEGNRNIVPETLVSYEFGYRTNIADLATINVASFYNIYADLVSFEPITPVRNRFGNKLKSITFGVEIDADVQLMDWWQLRMAYSFIRMKASAEQGSKDLTSANALRGNSPKHQISLRSMMNLNRYAKLDLWGRYVGKVSYPNDRAVFLFPANKVGDYFNLDVRFSWQISKPLKVSFTARNLLHKKNMEYIQEINIQPSSIGRSYNLMIDMIF